MTLRRSLIALPLALLALALPARAAQQSFVMPSVGPMSLGTFVTGYLNPGLQALATCHSGTSAPANGPSSAPMSQQCWIDTSATPWLYKIYDGSSWVTVFSIDASAHASSVNVSSAVNPQTGTTFTVADGDRGKLVDFCNASPVAVTLPRAGSAGIFLSGWYATYRNSCAGTVTITPTVSTVDGNTTIVLRQYESIGIRSDGTNYKTTYPSLTYPNIGVLVQAWDADLDALAGLTSAAGKIPYFTGTAAAATFDSTSYGRSLSNAADASALRTLAGAVIGTNVQAWDADLDALAANSTNGLWAHTGAGTGAARTLTQGTGITVANGDGVSGNPTVSLTGVLTSGGPIGSGTVTPIITWNAQGQVTAVTSATIAPPFSALTGSLACSQMPALTGDITSSAGACATTLANIPSAVPMAGSLLATNVAAPGTPASGKTSIYIDSTDKRLHDKNDAGVIGTTVVADTGASNNFLTAISAAGAVSKAQPAFSNLSGSATCAQLPALTGDVTSSAGACATTLANIPTATPAAGYLLWTNIAAPSTPASGKTSVYVDSTQKVLSAKNDAGTVSITTVPSTAVSNQFLTGVTAAGVYSRAQPAFTDLSGSNTATQIAGSAASHAVPVDVGGTPTWKVVPDCTDTSGNHLNYTQSTYAFSCGNTSSGGGGGSSTIILPQGRLTLQSGVSVMTADQVAKATLYYACHNGGNQVPYYSGSADVLDTIASCQVSTAMQSSSTGVLNSAGVFDVWWVHSGASRICVATNGSGGGWASDTGGSNQARGTGYSQIDKTTRPYITNANSITHCYNGATDYGAVSANQATYLGTIYTTAAGQTGVAFKPTPASGGSNNIIGVSNGYNRVPLTSINQDSSAWSVTNTSAEACDVAVGSGLGNRISWVDGLQQSSVMFINFQVFTTSGGSSGRMGSNLDAATGTPNVVVANNSSTAVGSTVTETFAPQIGFHYVQCMNYVTGSSSGYNPNPFNSLILRTEY